MAEGDFWFFLGAVSLSAGVIAWVGFLEISYRLERRRRRAGSIGLAGLKTATEAIVLAPPAAGVRSREQLRLLVRTAVPKRKLSIRLPMWPLSKHVKQPSGPNVAQLPAPDAPHVNVHEIRSCVVADAAAVQR
jgi:hypothetical protein